MSMERSTFSQAWGRICQLTPTLRPQTQVRRRLFRGEPWYVLQDVLGNQFVRVNPVDYFFIGLLDGRRTVEQAWHQTLERFGDDAPTQGEVISVLGQLNQTNLLRVDLPADARPLLERHRKRQIKQWRGQAMSVLFLRIPIFNPDRLLKWLLPVFRPVLSLPGLVLWAIWMVFALVLLVPHLPEFLRQSTELLFSPSNWGWLMVMFVLIKAFHELGHGLVCRRFGGGVYEAGIMLLVLFPCPYMDTTTAWAFDNRWKRLLVSSAGMIFELAVAGVAVLIWVNSQDDLVRQMAHNVILIASIGTLFFNGNPLMRFDGYFMFSDIVDVPNLYERATNQLKWLCQRYLYGLKQAMPPSVSGSEQTLLTVYGVAALLYRVLIMFTIVFVIAGFAFFLGLALAAWTMLSWLMIPTGKFIHWLAAGPALQGHRPRALAVTAGLLVAGVVLLGIWPMPDHRYVPGVVEAAERAEVVVQAGGLVQRVYVMPGERVQAGQILLEAVNAELQVRREEILADLVAVEVGQRDLMRTSPVERLTGMARMELLREQLEEVEHQLKQLTVRSPMAGILIAPNLTLLEGRYLEPGTTIAQVINPDSLRVTALVDQSHNSLVALNEIQSIELRVRGMAGVTLASTLEQVFDAGRHSLPHPSLSTRAGGSIAIDPEARDQMTTERPYFHLWLSLPATEPGAVVRFWPGQRVHVRMTLETRRPWLAQWAHRFRQIFDERITL